MNKNYTGYTIYQYDYVTDFDINDLIFLFITSNS